jgi:hypothetical protein
MQRGIPFDFQEAFRNPNTTGEPSDSFCKVTLIPHLCTFTGYEKI